MISIFILLYTQHTCKGQGTGSNPRKGTPRGEAEGGLVLYYQKLCVISILGFSIVGNSKMTFIFHSGYPQPPCKGALRGGLWAYRGFGDTLQ